MYSWLVYCRWETSLRSFLRFPLHLFAGLVCCDFAIMPSKVHSWSVARSSFRVIWQWSTQCYVFLKSSGYHSTTRNDCNKVLSCFARIIFSFRKKKGFFMGIVLINVTDIFIKLSMYKIVAATSHSDFFFLLWQPISDTQLFLDKNRNTTIRAGLKLSSVLRPLLMISWLNLKI